MKEIGKKLAGILLLFIVAITGSIAVYADTPDKLEGGADTMVYVNPLYADVVEPADLTKEAEVPAKRSLLSREKQEFESVDEAGVYVRKAMVNRQGTINFAIRSHGDNSWDDLHATVEKAMEHTPETRPDEGDYLRFTYSGYGASRWMQGQYDYYEIKMTYFSTAEQEAEVTQKLAEVYQELGLNDSMNDYQKTVLIYDYITDHVSYDYDLEENCYCAYAALIKQKAVCQGYSNLMYRMLNDQGISTRIMAGNVGTENHSWNILKLGNKYYNADSTWDAGMRLNGYGYFLKGSRDFTDHVVNDLFNKEFSTEAFKKSFPVSEVSYHEIRNLSEALVTFPEKEILYTGMEIRPDITLTLGGKVLKNGEDYTVTYRENANAGTAQAVFEGIDPYTGTLPVSFEIGRRSLNDVTVQLEDFEYTGREMEAPESLIFKGAFLQRDKDYQADYTYDWESKTGKAVFTGMNNYKDSVTREFKFTVKIDNPFTDVDMEGGNWFFDEVLYVYGEGIMKGMGDGSGRFEPYQTVSRAQFAMTLYRMEGEPKVEYTDKFKDVAQNEWYTEAVMWAEQQKIVTGYSNNGLFGPADQITREQMAVMMYRYAAYKKNDMEKKADLSVYKDAGLVSSFAQEAMEWAVGSGIITGKFQGTILDPQGETSRAECAIILTRFLKSEV